MHSHSDRQRKMDIAVYSVLEQNNDKMHSLVVLFPSFFGRPFVKQFALCYRTVVLSVLYVLSVYLYVSLSVSLSVTFFHCGQTVGWIKMKLGMQVGLDRGHTVRWEPAPPPPKGHTPHNIWPIFVAAIWLDGSA